MSYGRYELRAFCPLTTDMYAITHAASALPIQRLFPRVGLWPLLIGAQAIELLWVLFTYTGIEHITVSGSRIHLGFLPYSHSVGSTLALAPPCGPACGPRAVIREWPPRSPSQSCHTSRSTSSSTSRTSGCSRGLWFDIRAGPDQAISCRSCKRDTLARS
jgi:hypothetical protein